MHVYRNLRLVCSLVIVLGCQTPNRHAVVNKTNDTIREEAMNPDSIKIADHSPAPVSHNGDDTAACIRKMIERFSKEEVTNPPRKVYSYEYKGEIVYYVPALCCDFFSDLYDANCNLIGHPDGGYTGRGDGGLPDFLNNRKKEKLIWEDQRQP